jgi:hypothetical protein
LPQFETVIYGQRNEATGKLDDYYLVVINNGGPVQEFTAEPAFFLRVGAVMNRTPQKPLQSRVASTTFDLPVDGYFSVQAVSAAGKGQLVKITGYHNNASMSALAGAARELNSPKGEGVTVDELVYVCLRYRDLLDRWHEDYYRVPYVGGGWRMADADGREVFRRWKDRRQEGSRVELSSLNIEQLLTEATNRIEKEMGISPAQ